MNSFLTGSNALFVEELYSRYLSDPRSVDEIWATFFAELDDDGSTVLRELKGASWAPSTGGVIGKSNGEDSPKAAKSKGELGVDQMRAATLDSIRALMLIRSYRVRGHLIARFDPLGMEGNDYHPELDPKSYGFTDADMDRPIYIDNVLGLETATLRQIVEVLQQTYCNTIGVEFMHIQEPEEKAWIQQRIEGMRNHSDFTEKGKRAIYERLVEATGFEKFCDVKYPGTKRFGLDGGESMIPAVEQILKRGSQLGVKEIVIGMPHRGRLNVLSSIMQKPYVAIFSEFQGVSSNPDDVGGSGDVKYHLGTSADRDFDGHAVHLSLTANPSHLEWVNPVVLGKVRAKQHQRGNAPRQEVLGILMHGDAAFPGQGVVPETLMLSELRGYRTGGTIHLIVNNQIGFTTAPSKSRSSPYPSDIAKGIQALIFHVNGDDPEAVVHVARLATEFRHEFKRDVVIDMFCYRRHGHNEGDEPAFTQPIMYKTIAKHPTTREVYAAKLVGEGVMTAQEADRIVADFQARLEKAYEASFTYKPNKADWLEGSWKGLVKSIDDDEDEAEDKSTAVPLDLLKEVGTRISEPPKDFAINSKILRQLADKRKMIETGEGIDWATAEALAFGTLLVEGTGVRLSGQDSGRGTFSQRHAVLVDQENENRYFPLSNIRPKQATFEVMDSPLSEAGVLGFEYGYSLADPLTLTLWEAQFGDFANTAQPIIDQFIASGESKWLRMCGLVMLLPHGYEGQGPEHSSARLERFLQLCAEDNLQLVNLTTPAQYFHALRRQMRRNYRKPLIVMAPKSLLRHKLVVSKLADMGPDTRFRRVLPETDKLVAGKNVRRVILCSGKIYYDLLEKRRAEKIDDVAIIRVEQIYPWPRKTLLRNLSQFPNAEVIWCQEEPANMGAWLFAMPRLDYLLAKASGKAKRPLYVGRRELASTATGSGKVHAKEQAAIVESALKAKTKDMLQPFLPPNP